MKNILLGIGPDYCLEIKVQIDANKIKRVNDLKQIISSKFQVSGDFTIEKAPNDDLSKIKEDYVFKIKFSNASKDLNFKLPNKKIIKLEKSDDKEFKYIISSFSKKGIFYSDNCKNNLIFYAWGKKILKSKSKPFFNFPSSSIFDLKMSKEPIILRYENKQFIFSENEQYTSVSNFILQSFAKNIDDLMPIQVNIFRNQSKKYLKSNDILQKNDVLDSIVKDLIVYNEQLDGSMCIYVKLDLRAKISDLRHNIALYYDTSDENIILKTDNKEVKEMNINILDLIINNFIKFEIKDQKIAKKPIKKSPQEKKKSPKGNKKASKAKKDDDGIKIKKDDKKTLKPVDIPKTKKEGDNKIKKDDNEPPKTVIEPQPPKKQAVDKKKFIPKTKPAVKTQENEIKVYFIFETSKESFSETFSPETTIEEIITKIESSHKIKGKIEIKYADKKGKKISIDPKMTLADNSDEMKYESNGSVKNVLFISVKPPPTVKVNIKDLKKGADSDDDDDDDEVEFSKEEKNAYNATKRPPPKKKSKEIEYTFEYHENHEKVKLKSDTSLKENENDIKKLFKIDRKNQIQYRLSFDEDGGEVIVDENSKMSKFEGKTIIICILSEKNEIFKPGTVVYKYFYQTNTQAETVYEIELPSDALVKTLKIAIADEQKVKSTKDIKVLFAGKDLLNNLVLKDLKIGPTILSIYIRSFEDIILMTAKALIVEVDIEEEEEDKECSDSDMSDDDYD